MANGSPVAILDDADRWYRVQSGSQTGYMHHTWVLVDQYDSGPSRQRHIQIKSFDNLAEANAYARSASIAVSAYLVTNGWFAITLEKTYDEQMARNLVALLKKSGAIPDDAFVTYGNTYVRKVCCQQSAMAGARRPRCPDRSGVISNFQLPNPRSDAQGSR
ncbi:hypothetical protein [Mesorhizobium sp. f-mel]